MKILVTGGAGYIGSHTVVELILAGHQPVIVDSLVNAKPSVVERIERITGYRTPLHRIDIRDEDALARLVADTGFDAVMHFAGLKAVGESVADPLSYYDTNVGGATTLLNVLKGHRLKTIVFSSSATVYGDPDTIPVSELTPTRPPTNPYGRSKLMIEQILSDLHLSRPGWNIGILRYFNPVGAHDSGLLGEDPGGVPNNLMPYITQVATKRLSELKVFGADYPTRDGTGIRDYVHVVDLAKGHLAALERLKSHPGLHVWNLGTGRGTTVLELVAAFERAAGVKIPYRIGRRRPGDVAAIWADPSLAEIELGWKAVRNIEMMCTDAWRWQQRADHV